MLSFLFPLFFTFAQAQEKIQVKSFTPQGYLKSVEQVRIEFSHPMVRFGDLKLETPATSSCFKNGQGRWVDTRNWVFDFNEPLSGGNACSITVLGKSYSFNTGGPHVVQTFPESYVPVSPDQNFVLILDAPAKRESLGGNVYFLLEGLGDRIEAEVVEGSESKAVQKAVEDAHSYRKDIFNNNFVVVKAPRNFPPGAKVSLIWSKKVQSQAGYSSPLDEVFEFTIMDPFKLEFGCEREAPGKPCIPLLGMRLSTSSAISVADARQIYVEGPDKKKTYPSNLTDKPEAEKTSYLVFAGPFPANSEFKVVVPKNVKDDLGRSLSNQSQFPLSVKTGDDPVLLKFGANFGVVEAGPEAAVAVTMRRVEKTLPTLFYGWSGKLAASDFKKILENLNELSREPYGEKRLGTLKNIPLKKMTVKKPLKSSDMEVVGIPLKEKGFYVLEMESPLLGQALLAKKSNYYVRTAALVTDMAVHAKYGSKEAWIWVTDLKTAKVLPRVNVKIFDVAGNQISQTKTDEKGLAYFSFNKEISNWPRRDDGFYYEGFFAVAEKEGDFSFTHSSWDKGIEPWRFQLGYADTEPIITHAILDRTLFKPGETVSAKILIRKNQGRGLGLPATNEWPKNLTINHDSSLQSFKIPLQWHKSSGTALIKWTLPEGAKLGRWILNIERGDSRSSLDAGSFSVENFRVPLVQVRLSSGQPSYVQQSNIPLNITGTFFAGGPTVNWPMKMRWSVEPSYFSPEDDDFQDFTFANGGVTEGLFRSGEDETPRYIPQSGTEAFELNKEGSASVDIMKLKYGMSPQRLRAEVEYKDPNGEIQTVIRSFAMWPSELVLGIKSKSWWTTPQSVEFDTVALDLLQRPVKRQKIQVDLYTSNYFSHRKRLVGGFYSYEDFREYKKIGKLCEGLTNEKGLFNCVGQSKVAGSVLAVVSAKDSQGRVSMSNVTQWIVKPGSSMWFGSDDNDRADLIPFKKKYEPGEVAEFQLRTPFPESKVLVTVERDTVLYSEVVDVKGDRPILRIPIKKEYAPNVVVSAFAIRGRLSEPKPTALVDLGKPAFKLGMAGIKVGWKENTLNVSVTTDRKQYRARDKSLVTVTVKDAQGSPAKQGEVALIAVDEGLLELRENHSWDLLSQMMRTRGHSISMATAQSLVIGKRHFGLKAVPIGGDGGGGLRRELFDTLLYWNPVVKLDAQGQARVQIPLNDSTTSFRIVAVAQRGVDQFGTGWTSIQSTQDVMILPGLAGVAREGDEFQAGFTVRNASSASKNLKLTLEVSPNIGSLAEQKISLNPGEAKEVFWKVKVPGTSSLVYVLKAFDENGKVLDEIKKTQRVLPLRVPRIYQSEWGAWPDFTKLSLKRPPQADPSKSSLVVEVNEGLGGSLLGVQDYWSRYAYNCLEQQVSRAVSLNDKKLWRQLESKMNVYLDENGLLKYFPSANSKGSVILTAYILSLAHEAGFEFSEENETKMLAAVESFAEGRLREEGDSYQRADQVLKKVSVFEALSRYRRLNLSLLSSVDFQGTQWPLYSLVEWYQIHLWEAKIPQREKRLAEIENILRSRFYFTAKRLQLKEAQLEDMPWLMRSQNTAILRLISTTLPLPQWKSDIPRLYRGALSRQSAGAWLLTADNAWGALMMRKMKMAYAKEKVQGLFEARLDGVQKRYEWKQGSQGALEFPWNKEEAQLQLQQQGLGKPWITVSAKSAWPVTKATYAGFTVTKTIVPIEQKEKGRWSVGDTAKVELLVKTKAPQTWVVIEDPIPAGASILQSSWATAIERKEELIRFYFVWFDSDSSKIEYTIRLNQAGTYGLPAPRVEAMYSPDIFAELPESSWTVQ